MRAIALLILGLILWAMPARAELVLASGDGVHELRLYESPCTHAGTIGHIKTRFEKALPEHLAKFRNARILDKRGTIASYGCWVESDDGAAFVLFEDGSDSEFPLSKFSDPTI